MRAKKPGFQRRAVRRDLLGKHSDDWRTYVAVCAPYLPDNGEIISLSNQYYLSLGAHATHTHLLMDRDASFPLTVQRSLTACALLTFVTDSPVIPLHSERTDKYAAADLQSFQSSLAREGLHSTEEYFSRVAQAAEATEMFVELSLPKHHSVMREVPEYRGNFWPYIDWPESAATWRGLTAFWSGTLATSLPSRILNFWRSIEAVTTKASRYELFDQLDGRRALPIWSTVRSFSALNPTISRTNAANSLRRRALRRRDELMRREGTPAAALDWLYWERRGKAAHADKSSLDFEGLATFADQLADSILFHYMARIAIEEHWA